MVLDKRTIKRERMKRKKITVTQTCQKSLEKREGNGLPVHRMMKSPKAAKRLLSSSVLWSTGSSHLKEGGLAQEEMGGTVGFELSWYTKDYILQALHLLELHYMSIAFSDGTMYKTLQPNEGRGLSPVFFLVSFTKQWLLNVVHKNDLGILLNPTLLVSHPRVHDSGDLGYDLKVCISIKLPSAVGLGQHM